MKYRLSLVCACLVVCGGCNPSVDQNGSGAPSAVALDEPSENATQLVSLKVDGMTCPSGCYPSVRSAIAKQDGVLEVELAPQQKKDVIDNPVVFVKYKGKLDLDATFKAIERAGFEAHELPN